MLQGLTVWGGCASGDGGGAGVCGIVTVPYQIQKRVKTDLC